MLERRRLFSFPSTKPGEIPIIVSHHMAAGTCLYRDGVIITDSLKTLEGKMDDAFLRSCGIAPADAT